MLTFIREVSATVLAEKQRSAITMDLKEFRTLISLLAYDSLSLPGAVSGDCPGPGMLQASEQFETEGDMFSLRRVMRAFATTGMLLILAVCVSAAPSEAEEPDRLVVRSAAVGADSQLLGSELAEGRPALNALERLVLSERAARTASRNSRSTGAPLPPPVPNRRSDGCLIVGEVPHQHERPRSVDELVGQSAVLVIGTVVDVTWEVAAWEAADSVRIRRLIHIAVARETQPRVREGKRSYLGDVIRAYAGGSTIHVEGVRLCDGRQEGPQVELHDEVALFVPQYAFSYSVPEADRLFVRDDEAVLSTNPVADLVSWEDLLELVQ